MGVMFFIKAILIGIATTAVVWFLSYVQMKARLHVIEKYVLELLFESNFMDIIKDYNEYKLKTEKDVEKKKE